MKRRAPPAETSAIRQGRRFPSPRSMRAGRLTLCRSSLRITERCSPRIYQSIPNPIGRTAYLFDVFPIVYAVRRRSVPVLRRCAALSTVRHAICSGHSRERALGKDCPSCARALHRRTPVGTLSGYRRAVKASFQSSAWAATSQDCGVAHRQKHFVPFVLPLNARRARGKSCPRSLTCNRARSEISAARTLIQKTGKTPCCARARAILSAILGNIPQFDTIEMLGYGRCRSAEEAAVEELSGSAPRTHATSQKQSLPRL